MKYGHQEIQNNTEIAKKIDYEKYGVEEYYEYDSDRIILKGWIRKGFQLEEIPEMEDWVSPRLGVRFEMKSGELKLFHPDGSEFLSPVEMAEKAEKERYRAEMEKQRAETAERSLLNEQKEKLEALQQIKIEKQRAELLAQKLRELGIEL